jgi:very-short-patch-repair endonuclease
MTEAERRLWRNLCQRQMEGYKFRRQHPLGRYVLDFVCLEARVVVEVDGGQHVERSEYDRVRADWLEQRGFRLLRFWNDEVLNHTDAVRGVILQALVSCPRPPPVAD